MQGLRECDTDVRVCYYELLENGHRSWMIDDVILTNLGSGLWARLRKRFDFCDLIRYIRREKIDLVYMRSDHNANPFTIGFVRQVRSAGCKVIMEIPTYPYDREYDGHKVKLGLFIDRLFRRELASYLDAIVTFSDYDYIFGQKTIKISNGIDLDTIPLRNPRPKEDNVVHLLAVAEIHYWHGFDRMIEGLARYAKQGYAQPIVFHLVGQLFGEREQGEILDRIQLYGLQDQVVLYGPLSGHSLDQVFDIADFAIGSLGRHRTGITNIKTLKNREYAARGIPFMYSESDADFDHQDFVLKTAADDSPIDIKAIVDFVATHQFSPQQIREHIKHLTWRQQMRYVLNAIYEK